jgi:endoglucanase
MVFWKGGRGRVLLSSLAALSIVACGSGGSGNGSGGALVPEGRKHPPTPTPTPALASLGTPAQVVQAMAPGINLGNTLEAVNGNGPFPYSSSQETFWGNPAANQAVFNAYAAAGFKSVRIPVAYSQYADSQNNIAPFWFARVKQVVDYARNAGLYVIINIHWDGGWLIPDFAHQTAVTDKQKKFWTQIANEFASYDNHLIFAGSNEPAMPNVYTAPTQENCTVQKGYNQAFVDAVRATGGNNASRTLVVQLYATNIDWGPDVCNEGVMPTDSIANRLMIEMHWYDPFDFTINGNDTTHWQWGALATDLSAVETWGNEAHSRQEFDKAMSVFVNKGVPVIMGEFGSYPKGSGPGAGNETYTNYWAQYNTYAAVTRGIVPMWWDTGSIIDRNSGAVKDSGLLNALKNGMTTNPEPPGSVGNANNN